MKICDMFTSIQGEGRWLGLPVIFLRTQGCSAHCSFCDTKESWADKGHDVDPRVLVKQLESFSAKKIKTVVITGGEPTEQDDLYTVAEELKYTGFSVHLETNGNLTHIARGYFDWIVCSPKEVLGWNVTKNADELKYVVKDGDDLNFIIPAWIRDKFNKRILLQPCANGNDVSMQNWKYCYQEVMKDPRLRVGIQMHKILEVK